MHNGAKENYEFQIFKENIKEKRKRNKIRDGQSHRRTNESNWLGKEYESWHDKLSSNHSPAVRPSDSFPVGSNGEVSLGLCINQWWVRF